MLQARGRDRVVLGLIGIWKGMPPVAITQRQAEPLPIIVLSALQHPGDGAAVPLPLDKKFKQGVKLVSIVAVHGDVTIWALIGKIAKTIMQERKEIE